jgi:hypothetical protein
MKALTPVTAAARSHLSSASSALVKNPIGGPTTTSDGGRSVTVTTARAEMITGKKRDRPDDNNAAHSTTVIDLSKD